MFIETFKATPDCIFPIGENIRATFTETASPTLMHGNSNTKL